MFRQKKLRSHLIKYFIELLTMGRADQGHIVYSLSDPNNFYCLLRKDSELVDERIGTWPKMVLEFILIWEMENRF